ncbi:SRPBCC family protein [Salipaludibacillus sp. HK11]|uniref:SRPBCC family protein n=1 Tax=Salipaludibacillus sp. HK11 TaxID=3394320 RepID=UPI0039FDD8D3
MFRHTFYYKTEIQQPISDVWSFFQTNENLAAITAFPKINILGDINVFEGAIVHLQLDFIFIKLEWKGKITKVVDEAYFMDEAEQLPFPFKSWKHVHAFKKITNDETRMIDRVEYEAYVPPFIANLVLKGMFADRKKQLKKKLG